MQKQHVVELKGGLYTLLSLRLHSSDIDAIEEGLADKVQQAPGFFSNTPVVIDISRIENSADFDAEALIQRVRAQKLVPVLINAKDREAMADTGLSVPVVETSSRDVPMQKARQKKSGQSDSNNSEKNQSQKDPAQTSLLSGSHKKTNTTDADGSAKGKNANTKDNAAADKAQTNKNAADDEVALDTTSDTPVASDSNLDQSLSDTGQFEAATPRLIKRPVRSGQQLYARDTDLIIMAHVGPGAEIVADGNIHVYGPLRGRALCGVTGNTEARIFCQSLEAELVSVAGNYRLLEEIPEELFGKPAQIWFDDGRLNIDPL